MASEAVETRGEHKLPTSEDSHQRIERAQWLRAAILGANDGLLSTTSIMLGVGAAKDDRRFMVLSGLAGALAGASSMAVGEFVSVSTQRDIGKACHAESVIGSFQGSADANSAKSVSPPSATNWGRNLPSGPSPGRYPMMKQVATDARENALIEAMEAGTHVGKEVLPNPYKAAMASSLAFLCGSFIPLLSAIIVEEHAARIMVIAAATSAALAFFGGFGAHLGGSPVRESALRVLVGGWSAMAITYGLMKAFNTDHESTDDD